MDLQTREEVQTVQYARRMIHHVPEVDLRLVRDEPKSPADQLVRHLYGSRSFRIVLHSNPLKQLLEG